MADQTLLRWIDGEGWLVFSGGNTAGSPLRAKVLARAKPDGPVVYISLADDRGDALMDDMEDLGAPAGFLVDIEHEDPESIYEQIKPASVIVIEIGNSVDQLYEALLGPASNGIQAAYEHGAIALFEGLSMNLLGKWVISDQGELLEGLDWVQNAFIEPDSSGAQGSRAVQAVLESMTDAVAIGIDAGSALALGRDSQVELWGDKDVRISLGKGYSDNAS